MTSVLWEERTYGKKGLCNMLTVSQQ